MPKKKKSSKEPQQKADVTKLQQDARQQHVQESTAVVLATAPKLQKELIGEWMQEAVAIKKQELLEGLERGLAEHENFRQSTGEVLQSLKWGLQDTQEALDSAVQTLHQTHEDLAALQQRRVLAVNQYLHSRAHALKDFFLENIGDIANTHSKFKRELLNLIQMIEDEENKRQSDETHEEATQFEFIRNRSIESEHQLQSSLEQKIKNLKERIETALQSYTAATDSQSHEYRRLLQQDRSLSQQVDAKITEVERMQAAINHWKAKVAQHKLDFESRNARIKGEVEHLRRHCRELRDEMETARGTEKQRLVAVSLCAREKKARLLGQLELADKLHRMAALCNKYERKHPAEPLSDIDPRIEDTSSWSEASRKLHKSLVELMDSRGNDWGVLEAVFQRISRVTLETACLSLALESVSRENRGAREVISSFRASMSLPTQQTDRLPPSCLSVQSLKPATSNK